MSDARHKPKAYEITVAQRKQIDAEVATARPARTETDVRKELVSAEAELASWQEKLGGRSGNNPNKFQTNIRMAAAKVRRLKAEIAQQKLKEEPSEPAGSEDQSFVSPCGRYRVGQTWTPTKPGSRRPSRKIVEFGPTENALEGEIFYRASGGRGEGRSVTYEKWERWVELQSAACSEYPRQG
jgi:hypothetical protein